MLQHKTALITGASNGIGLEFAKVFAKNGYHVVLVARSAMALQNIATELAHTYSITATVIVADLSTMAAVENVVATCKAQQITIDYLVNNAGFGSYGFFVNSDWDNTAQMIDLNIKALTYLCKLVAPLMVANKYGRILNVASTAAFQPGPLMAVYFATKAYVLHFGEALHNELQGTGVSVTTLCPGATASNFFTAASMNESILAKGKKLPTAAAVAACGYKAMQQQKLTVIHGTKNYILANGIRFATRNMVLKITRKVLG